MSSETDREPADVEPADKEQTDRKTTQTRVALMGIIIENPDSTEKLNSLLHEYRNYIIGRMGVPYKEKNLSIISIALDAPQNVISALSGKTGMLPGISSKVIYSNV